jgi:multiple sugar transport system permease protein
MQINRQRLSLRRVAAYAVLGAWSIVCGFPVYWLVLASIKPVSGLPGYPGYIPFLDFSPSLAAWRFILADPAESLLPSFGNSLLIGAVASATSLLAAGLAVYAVTRIPARGRLASLAGSRATLGLMLAVRVMPPVVLALPSYVLASRIGLLDSRGLLAGIYAAINLPVAVWLLLPVFGDRATEQEEAALLEGVSHAGILFTILLPMLRRPAAVAGLFLFILCWNEYLFAAYLAFDEAKTLSPWMAGQLSMKEAQAGGDAEEMAHMAAAAVFMALPAFAFAAATQRLLARSLAPPAP